MKRIQKMISVVVITLLLAVGSMGAVWAAPTKTPSVVIDGQTISFSGNTGTPYIDGGNRLLVPIRVFSEQLGADVVWDEGALTATIDGNIKIKVGEKNFRSGTETVAMDTQAVQKNGRLYVPLRYIANALGYKVEATGIKASLTSKNQVMISAAASLKDALNEVKALYSKTHGKTSITINYGGSGTLAQQIAQGAKVDIFISASAANMNDLKAKGLIEEDTIKNLLGNTMVLIVPKDSKNNPKSFADLINTQYGKVALGEPKTVPAGQYAEDIFTKLGVLDKIKAKVVYGKDVKEVLTWVETGNVDAGVVYGTDAKVSTKVRVTATAPDNAHKAIVYPIGAIKNSENNTAAKAFVRFMETADAKAIFEKYGFRTY